MSLYDRITEDMKAAMRAKESARLSAIRLLLAALKQKQVDERAPGKESAALADPDVLAVIDKMIKQRRESIAQFEKAGRNDLVAGEKFEIDVLSAYLPQPLGRLERQGHGQGDGAPQSAPCRPRRHGESVGAGED